MIRIYKRQKWTLFVYYDVSHPEIPDAICIDLEFPSGHQAVAYAPRSWWRNALRRYRGPINAARELPKATSL